MKRILIFLLALTLTAGLFSCKNDNEENQGNVTFESEVSLVFADLDLKDIVNTLYLAIDDAMEGAPKIKDDKTEKQGAEIVFGPTERPISAKAYEKLDRIEAARGEYSYVIYSDGSSIAIAFDDDPSDLDNMARIAMEAFVEKCLKTDKTFTYPEGTVKKETIDLVAFLKEEAQPEIDKKWSELANAIGENGDEIVTAMKQLYSLSTDDLIPWFANLYDPAIGGYYYSNSGRDTYTFLPDIESTAQALGFITSSGLSGGKDIGEVLPEWMQKQIAEFIKGLQDPNGFFYHPQWTKEFTDTKVSRLSRDLGNAVSVLKGLGYAPTYNTPNGDKGDGKHFDGTPVSAQNLTVKLGGSTVSAVSKVIPAAAYFPHLENKDTFIAYLDSLNIQTNSYSAGNTLTAQKGQITERDKQLAASNAGYSLMDILIEYLNDKQFENGLWNAEENYFAVNGLMKIGGVYGEAEVLMPRADKAVMAAMRAMTTDEEPGAVTDVYNTWFAVSRTLRHMRDYGTVADKARANELRTELYEVAPEALRATAEKLAIFKKQDGSFSYGPSFSSSNSQGCPVAVPGTVEGDVNATVICTHDTLNYVYSALGLSEYEVPQYSYGDWVNYLTILNNLGPVIKDEENDTKEPYTFDDDNVDGAPGDVSAVLRSPTGYIKVIQDPRENSEGNVCEMLSISGTSDYIAASCTSPSTANRSCYVFEADLCMLSSNSSYPIQISMEKCYMLTLRTSGDKVKIIESTSASGSKSKDTVLAPSPSLGEWFNVRVEYYPGEMEDVRIKFYYNGELTAVTDGFYDEEGLRASTGKATPATQYTFAQIYVLKSAECNLMVDNIYSYKENKKYTPYTDTEHPLIYNVDEPERVYEIDDTAAGKGKYYTGSDTTAKRYDFSKELTIGELYNKVAGAEPIKTLNTFYEGGKLRIKNDSNWKGVALANTSANSLSGESKYVFECDFTWVDGKQSEDTIGSGAAFIGLLGDHAAVDNTYMFTYDTFTLDKNDSNKAKLFGQSIDRCKTYNIRIEYTPGIGTKVYMNDRLIEATLAVGKNAKNASFEGFGFYFRKGFEYPIIIDLDNVYMNTVALDESDFPTLEKNFETYYDGSYEGTRYNFSEEFTLDVYNKDTAPKGILSAALTTDSNTNLTNGNATLGIKRGALSFTNTTAAWTGFTIANRGNTAGDVGSTYVFEADICYNGGTLKASTTDYRIAFVGLTAGNENNANMANYDYLTLNDKEGKSFTLFGYTFERGVIYNLRIESVVGGEFKVFVNGKEVYKPTYSTTKTADANTYAGFGMYFRGRCDNLNFSLDNVFMANYAVGEAPTAPKTELVKITANVPTLPTGVDSFYDYSSLEGTRYDFSEAITLDVYNKDTAPSGILAGEATTDTQNAFANGSHALSVKDGALEYSISTPTWSGFTLAYQGDRKGGEYYTYIFEADITYCGGVLREGAADNDICFAGMTTGNENNESFMNYNYISYTDNDGTALSWHGVTLEKDKTYNIRFVVIAGNEYHFYVDNVEVAVSKINQAGVSPDSFAGFGFYFRKRATDFKITFDNVFMTNIAPTIVIE